MRTLLALSPAQKGNGLVSLVAALSLALGVAGLAGAAPAAADVTCPTVSPSTGAVTPAPAPGVDWAGCDLSGANLTNASLNSANLTGANLSGANLTLASMSGADLTDANLTGANLTDAAIGDATLTGATLTGATLTGVGGGGIIGTPASLPANWTLISGHLFGPGAVLTDQNLSGLDLSGLDLTDVDFYGTNLGNTNLAGATLTGARSGKITGTPAALPADWSLSSGYLLGPGAYLQGALLSQASMPAADLAGANLDQAQLTGANLTGATLTNASLAQANLSQAVLTNAGLTGADLDGATLNLTRADHADLAAANLTGVDLLDASLTSANLAGAQLSGAYLAATVLDGANLTSANLTDANLGDADLTSAMLAKSTLTGAGGTGIIGNPASMPLHWSVRGGYLIGPGSTTDLTGADLSNLNLSGVDFTGLDLLRATFRHSNLTGANLTSANLTGADFTSANLTRADLLGAKVSTTWFVGTLWDDTTCPNGSNSSAHPHGWCFPPPPGSGFVASPLPRAPGGPGSTFIARALSCPSATLCYGGGSFAQPLYAYQAVLLRWQGGHWFAWPAPIPPGVPRQPNAQNAVAAVSCLSARMCVAGGAYGDRGMLLSWFGKKWTALKAPLPAAAASNPLATVAALSCPSLTTCFGVGGYMGESGEIHGLILRRSGRTWRAAAAPLPTGSRPDQSLTALSCPSAGLCFAGGWQDDATQQSLALMLTRNGGAWHQVNVPLPADAAAEPDAEISGLACPSVTQCVAVGSYTDAEGRGQGLLLTRSGTHWTAARAPLAWGAAGNPMIGLNAVSCPVTSHCTVVGTYMDAAAQRLGLVLTWSGKAWRAVPAPLIAYSLPAISCPTAARCVALGNTNNNEVVGLVGP